MKHKIIVVAFVLSLFASCASKKYDQRLNGIQKQISYLTDSYEKLSRNLLEIQDSLLVVQSQVESSRVPYSQGQDEKPQVGAREQSKARGSASRTAEETLQSKEKTAADTLNKGIHEEVVSRQEELPIFELGMEKKELKGRPGEVFKLDGGGGYIKIEGDKAKNREKATLVETATSDLPKSEPEKAYDKAFESYAHRRFDLAIKDFFDFLKTYPEHDLSDNASYWIGESYVGKGEYALALPEFQRIPLEYPNGNKVPDALLMVGICFEKLKNRDNAMESYKRLVSLYPSSMAAKKAQKKMESIQNEKSL